MWLIDLILNLAGLLLWLKWREPDLATVIAEPRISVVANLRRASPRYPRVIWLGILLAVLLIRSLFYWQLGPALNWIPKINFGVVALPFRSDFFGGIFIYSVLSFGATLGVFYLSLLLLSMTNRRLDADPVQKIIRVYLGWVDQLPVFVKLILPLTIAVLLWCVLTPLLGYFGILSTPKSFGTLLQQAFIAGLGVYLVWKYLLLSVLLLYLLNTYVYLGNWPFWEFIEKTGRQLLKFLARIPLRLGKLDFAPVVAIALVILAGEFVSRQLVNRWTGKRVQTIERLRR